MRSIRTLTVAVLLIVGLAACGGGSSNKAYCDGMTKAQGILKDFNPFDEQQLNQLLTVGAELLQSAPSDIKGEIQKLINAVNDSRQGKVPNTQELLDATNKIAQSAKDKCGIDLTPTTSSSSSDSSSSYDANAGADREFCNAFDFSRLGAVTTDPTAAKDFYDHIKDLKPPAQIQNDWTRFLEALGRLGSSTTDQSDFADLQSEYGASVGAIITYYGANCAAVN